jgi:hypothetical protein
MEGLNLKSRATDDFKGFGMAHEPLPLRVSHDFLSAGAIL